MLRFRSAWIIRFPVSSLSPIRRHRKTTAE
jgi:hypothetical protein